MKDFPMPNDYLGEGTEVGERIVVASVEYFDDARGAVALVLLLEPEEPYFTVAHYYLTDIAAEGDSPAHSEGDIEVLDREHNIVPAVEAYRQNGGDY